MAVKIQNLIPLPTNANPTSNYAQLYPTPNNQQTPTIKIDQILPDNSRLSFYFNKLTTNQLTNNDSLPQPVSAVRVQAIYGTIPRLNYDKSITPTLLLHAGVGYQRFHNPDSSPAGVAAVRRRRRDWIHRKLHESFRFSAAQRPDHVVWAEQCQQLLRRYLHLAWPPPVGCTAATPTNWARNFA